MIKSLWEKYRWHTGAVVAYALVMIMAAAFARDYFAQPVARESVWAILTSLLVALVFRWMKEKELVESFKEPHDNYRKVLQLAHELHSSKENYGLNGVYETVDECERILKLSENIDEENPPLVRWSNFKVEGIDEHISVIRKYIEAGGRLQLLVSSLSDNHCLDSRLDELMAGWSKRHEIAKDSPQFVEQQNLLRAGIIQRSARLIAFQRMLEGYSGSFEVRFAKGRMGFPCFIFQRGSHLEAYTGFYLLKRSSQMPYIRWETSEGKTVTELVDYFDYCFDIAWTVEQMAELPQIRKLMGNRDEASLIDEEA